MSCTARTTATYADERFNHRAASASNKRNTCTGRVVAFLIVLCISTDFSASLLVRWRDRKSVKVLSHAWHGTVQNGAALCRFHTKSGAVRHGAARLCTLPRCAVPEPVSKNLKIWTRFFVRLFSPKNVSVIFGPFGTKNPYGN